MSHQQKIGHQFGCVFSKKLKPHMKWGMLVGFVNKTCSESQTSFEIKSCVFMLFKVRSNSSKMSDSGCFMFSFFPCSMFHDPDEMVYRQK